MTEVYKTFIDDTAAARAAAVYKRLPEEMKTRVDKKRQISDKIRSLICLDMLGGGLEKIGLSLEDLYYEDSGKPCVKGAFVSISHSGDLCVCAVSDRPVGIDTEKTDGRYDKAVRLFNKREREYALKSPENFFIIWTKKEAALKITGEGIKGIQSVDTFDGSYLFETENDRGYIITTARMID